MRQYNIISIHIRNGIILYIKLYPVASLRHHLISNTYRLFLCKGVDRLDMYKMLIRGDHIHTGNLLVGIKMVLKRWPS